MQDIQELTIRLANESDLRGVLEIYSHYVLNSTFSLEETPPDLDEVKKRYLTSVERGMPYLVAKIGDKVVGFCYAFPYRVRSAYKYTVEESVYVHKDFRGKKIGDMLLRELVEQCKKKGFKQVVGVIVGIENEDSIKLHKKLGFLEVGLLKKVGFKFEKWIDIIIMQREL